MAHIQIRISHDEKKSAKQVLDKLGLTFSSAIKLFFRQMVRVQGLPFVISVTEVEEITNLDVPKEPEVKVQTTKPLEPKLEILRPRTKFSNLIESDFSAKKIGE